MRFIIGIILTALAAWCGWWFVGSSAQKTAWETWYDERRAAGWVAENSDVSVIGFPNRFDTTISDVSLADPQSGWAWSAPFFQVLMQSYQPNHVIAVWPDTQKISSPQETVTVTSETMRGSVRFVPNTDLTLDKTQIEILNLGVLGNGWTSALGSANFATRRVEAGDAPDFAHQIGFDAKELTLSEPLKRALDRTGILPPTMERAHFDVVAAFDAPWDRHSIEGRKPQLTAISIRDIDAKWGRLHLTASGKVTVDPSGYPRGDITLKARNWVDMLDLAVASGAVDRDIAETVRRGLGIMALLSGDEDVLEVPLSFSGGLTRLGPVPIGPAPKLTID